jgi:MYXO-CTERM domain-containing protein
MRILRRAIALGMLLALPASAQSTADNLEKYWALRTRQQTELTVIGDGPGQGQPATERNVTAGFIRWADSTIRLGWYIGVLATEHHMLTHPEQFPGADQGDSGRAAATLDELYYALRAMERLDEVADAAFPPPCTQTSALNGFFLRDDVPADFHQNFPGLSETRSDFVDPVLTNKEMSQDQVYHVLLGLAATKHFIPAGTTVNGKDLRSYAVEQATRIIQHIEKDGWVIKNPACDNRTVNRGPLASGFSGGTQRVSEFITDGAYVPETSDALIKVWEGAKSPDFAVYLDVDNLHMAMAIAAAGNAFGATTASDLATLSEKEDWPLYALLHRALHGDVAVGFCQTAASLNASAKLMLDELPKGAVPASPEPAVAVHGFTRVNRFMRGKDQAYTGEPGSAGIDFAGLDYMLLHNAYAIATPATWQGGSGPGIPECGELDGGLPDAGNPDGGGGGPGATDGDEDSGCGCRTAKSPRSGPAWFALAGLLAAIGVRVARRFTLAA